MDDLLRIADRFGMTAVVLFAIGIFLWRVLNWLKPWAEKLFAAHLALVEAIRATQSKHEATLEQIASTQTKQTDILEELKTQSKLSGEMFATLKRQANHGLAAK